MSVVTHYRLAFPVLVLGAIVLAGAVSVAGWRAGALSFDGAIAATAIGALILVAGGLPWALLLVAFFVTSSALTFMGKRAKARVQADFDKGGRRDAGQVLANGGIGAVMAICQLIDSNLLWFAGYAASLATVTADTWATEIGTLARGRTRLLTTWAPAAPGASGAISVAGTLAAAGGAALIAVTTVLAAMRPTIFMLTAVVLAGLVGCFADSLLGATIQASYFCRSCQRRTERTVHGCGASTRLISGARWITNDVVNVLSAAIGAGVGLGLAALAGAR